MNDESIFEDGTGRCSEVQDKEMSTAISLHREGKYEDAKSIYIITLRRNPHHFKASHLLGVLLYQTGEFSEAERHFRKAIEVNPHNDEAHYNLALTLRQLGRLGEAELATFKATEVNPQMASAWFLLSLMSKENGRDRDADIALERAISIDPENVSFRFRYSLNALVRAPWDIKESHAIPSEFSARLLNLKNWLDSDTKRYKNLLSLIGHIQPFLLAYRQGNHLEALSLYGDIITKSAESKINIAIDSVNLKRKIKLAIVSAYFNEHSVWRIIMKGIINHIDCERFELYFYHVGTKVDVETEWAKSKASQWLDGRSISQKELWLDRLQDDKPDVVFYPELGMDPTAIFLAAHRIAPLQIVSWGHPVTSGLSTIDMFLSGEYLESSSAADHYREKLVLLPGCGCCTESMNFSPTVTSNIDLKLFREQSPLFLICQQSMKYDPSDDMIFSDIALELVECRFLFVRPNYATWAFDAAINRIKNTFIMRGLDPDRYVHEIHWLDKREELLALFSLCDVYLDLPNFSGYTTAWLAVHSGLPIVTLQGDFLRQRLAAGILRQIGKEENIALTRQSFVANACMLARESYDIEVKCRRRSELKAAAMTCDNRVDVVRALETILLNEVGIHRVVNSVK